MYTAAAPATIAIAMTGVGILMDNLIKAKSFVISEYDGMILSRTF